MNLEVTSVSRRAEKLSEVASAIQVITQEDIRRSGATDTDFFHKADMEDSKILDSGLSDPADVAKNGYEALMRGDDKVVSGFKNKVMLAVSNVMPEEVVAAQTEKMQEPKDKS